VKYLTVQQVRCVDGASCEPRLAPLMDALLNLEDADNAIEEPDIAADVSTGDVDVQMIIEASDPATAMVKAFSALRTAIHTIGDAAPSWETASAVVHVAPADAAERILVLVD
jgi:hypothetical protein